MLCASRLLCLTVKGRTIRVAAQDGVLTRDVTHWHLVVIAGLQTDEKELFKREEGILSFFFCGLHRRVDRDTIELFYRSFFLFLSFFFEEKSSSSIVDLIN